MRRAPESEIEAFMSARLGRPCLFVPSGRLAVYLALRTSLAPGDRILMSPVNDDVIFFTALAAGLRPVIAPVSARDGNIDPRLVADEVWAGVAGVMTTNLYGLPDRVEELRSRCDGLGIALVEDAAHAIQTEVDGRLIGTFGDMAAFSLSKHVGAPCGGVLAFRDELQRPELERLRDAITTDGRPRDHVMQPGAYAVERLIVEMNMVWPVRWLRRRLGLTERAGFRMPLQAAELRQAIARAPAVDPFERWMQVDRHDYRLRPSAHLLGFVLRCLRRVDDDRARRLEGVERLRALPAVAPAVRDGEAQPLFRVPLLIDDREAMIARVERHIHGIGYIYDPPLDDYAGPDFAEESSDPAVARRWAKRVFPVDPLEAERFLRAQP